MKTTNNTVLITGGSAGIGFEMARLFSQAGNHVIILGRNEDRLQKAAAQLKNVTAIVCDVTKEKEVSQLVQQIERDFPAVNMLVNNAGMAYAYKMEAGSNSFEKAADEMLTNYLAIINITEQLLPVLSRHKEAAIINVSSIVALVPASGVPTYSASKAALHSYTQSLRHTLKKGTAIKVFELMPPLVNTEFSREIGGENGIHPEVVAIDLITAMQNDHYEVHVGNTVHMYNLALSAPADAFQAMNN